MLYRNIYIFLFMAVLLGSCGNRKVVSLSDIEPVIVPAALDTIIEVKNWIAFGPFEFDTVKTHATQSFFIEDLKPFGITEGEIDDAAIKRLQKKKVKGFFIRELSCKIKFFDYFNENIETKSNIYLVARIHAATAQDVVFIIDGSNSYTAWLNGEKLVGVREKFSNLKITDRFIHVSLREGDNTLFVKINRAANKFSWELIFAESGGDGFERSCNNRQFI